MKFSRIALLFLAMLLLLSVMTSCRCVPSDVEWHLQFYKADFTFIGGVVRTVNFSISSVSYPFAKAEKRVINVDFNDDGSVSFTTRDGETLNGTYTYEHQGSNYTKFTVTFENGEVATGDSGSYFGSSFMNFNFRGVSYSFIDKDYLTEENESYVVHQIRNGDAKNLSEATVKSGDEGYSVEFKGGDTVTISADTAVFAAHIDANNKYTALDEIRLGSCYAEYIEELDYLILYYIDPIAKK